MHIKTLRFFKGNILIKEEEELECAFVIVSGTVEVFKKLGPEKVIPITTLSKGQIVGEMSLFGDKKSTASVKALTDVEVQIIDKKVFEKYLQDTPPLIKLLLEILANKLLKTSHKYLIQSQSEAKINKFRKPPEASNVDFNNGKIRE
jgi:CRP-like cAMP-binding protein